MAELNLFPGNISVLFLVTVDFSRLPDLLNVARQKATGEVVWRKEKRGRQASPNFIGRLSGLMSDSLGYADPRVLPHVKFIKRVFFLFPPEQQGKDDR